MKDQAAASTVEQTLRERAEHLKELKRDWDSYDGAPIDAATADKAVELALVLADRFPSYPPQLVPAGDGTVQIEFHSDGWDVECWVARAEA